MSCYSTKSIILDSIKITYSLSKIIVSYVISLFKIKVDTDLIDISCSMDSTNVSISNERFKISCSVICKMESFKGNKFLVKEGLFKITPYGVYYVS